MRCGMVVWCMWNVLWCKMRNVVAEYRCGMVWRHIRHGVMRNDGWNAMWDVWCGLECVLWDSVMCNLNVMWCAWHDAWWNVGVMWNGAPRCGGAIWCELWCDVKCVRCGPLQFQTCCAMWNAIELQNVWCGIWRGVDCVVVLCEMLHNARCGKLRDVKCGGVELWWRRMWHMQCAVIVVSRQMWKMKPMCCDVRCGGVV